MIKPDRSTYTPTDFRLWRESSALILSPKFQRRSVWTTPARSYLIDTILRGMPIPPLYLRVVQSTDKKRTVREVIDGQQRISSVLDFLDDKFALSSSVKSEYSGSRFSKLPEDAQDQILQYPFITEVFQGISDARVLEIFSRLNTHSVKLNPQELRNGKFFGRFKSTAYELALEHLEFWRNHKIFTDASIARMAEVELTSELMVLLMDGPQDKKKTLDQFYAEYDEDFLNQTKIENAFRHVIDQVNDALGEELSTSQFRRPPLFYSLFAAVAHHCIGVPDLDRRTPKKRIKNGEKSNLIETVRDLSAVIEAARNGDEIPHKFSSFVSACLRQTDNYRPRMTRIYTIIDHANL